MARAAVALLCLALALGAAEAKKAVVKCSASNFNKVVKEDNDLVLVEFYAPWCGHCKGFAPIFEQAAKKLRNMDGVKLVAVDATAAEDLAKEYNVEYYPTMKLFRKGEVSDWAGPDDAPGIASYLTRQVGEPVKQITEEKEIKQMLKVERLVLVGVFDPEKTDRQDDIWELYEDAAETLREKMTIMSTRDSDLIQQLGVDSFPTVFLYRSFDERVTLGLPENTANRDPGELAGIFDEPTFADFASKHAVPPLDELSHNNYGVYMERQLPFAFLFLSTKEAKNKDNAQKAIMYKLAQKMTGYSFVYMGIESSPEHSERFNFTKKHAPALGVENNQGKRFIYDGDFSTESVEQFFADIEAGTAPMFKKSEPIPEPSHDEGVRVVVGNNWDEVVEDEEKDVLIEFYAPWCGHCQQLAPIYSAIAKSVEEVDSLVIAKIEGTLNDAPAAYDIQGFPSIFLVKAKTNEKVEYQGDRTKDDLMKFIKDNAAIDIDSGKLREVSPADQPNQPSDEPVEQGKEDETGARAHVAPLSSDEKVKDLESTIQAQAEEMQSLQDKLDKILSKLG